MKKQFKIMGLALLFIYIILFVAIQFQNRSFDELLGTNEENITKVVMRNGNNGRLASTKDEEKIKELINLLNDKHYRKSIIQISRKGYSFSYDFYYGNEVIVRVTGDGSNVKINKTYYHVNKKISLDSLTEWFNSITALEGQLN